MSPAEVTGRGPAPRDVQQLRGRVESGHGGTAGRRVGCCLARAAAGVEELPADQRVEGVEGCSVERAHPCSMVVDHTSGVPSPELALYRC